MPETIRWTVLPDGVTADGKLRLTVLVSPRLTGGTTLGAFPGFVDWPRTLAGYVPALQVEFRPPAGASTTLPTTAQAGRFPPPASTVWKTLFTPTTEVRGPTSATAAALARGVPPTLRSFPGQAVHQQIDALYETAVTTTAFHRAFPGGGSNGNGGSNGDGGAHSDGGANGDGGSHGDGGTHGSGGAHGDGGSHSTGGMNGTGGTNNAGDANGTGGPKADGPAAGDPHGEDTTGTPDPATPSATSPEAPPAPPSWDHPALDDLLTPLTDPIRTLAKAVGKSYPRLDDLIAGRTGGGIPAAENPFRPKHMRRDEEPYLRGGPMLYFAELYRFYDRPAAPPTPGTPDAPPAPPERPDLDFHGACALLADYPELLRRFGLAVDLLVTPPPGTLDQWQARVVFTAAQGHLNTDESLRPWTKLRHVAGQRFEPYADDDGTYGRRTLALGTADVRVTDLDVDGAAIKFVEFARVIEQALAGITDPEGSTAPDTTAPPALHGAGLTVLREAQDAALARQMEDDARHVAGVDAGGAPLAAAVLDASHLLRGYRVDVGLVDEATGSVTAWRPLCARTGTYTVRRAGQPPVALAVGPDEGHVKASTVTEDKLKSDELYVHQALFGWHGWSLVAPPPGLTIGADNRPQVPDPEIDPDFPLDTKFRPTPGTLPPLRYGRTYRLRARLVDLAGNSLGPAAPTADARATAPVTYGRWEPVPPPALVPKWPFLEGESEPRMVIRSTVDDDGEPMTPDAWARDRNGKVPDHERESPVDGLDRRYRAFDERHLSPPKSSLQMAEQHGAYDNVFGPGKPDSVRRRFFAAARREAGSYLDTVVRLAENPDLTHDLKAFGQIRVAKHNVRDTEPLTELPVPRGAGLRPGEYVLHTADQLLLPYLPDVLARGVSLRGLPGADPNQTYDFPGPWPQAKPLRLKIVEGEGPPRWGGPFNRELTVFLPKAEFATVRVSCHLAPADLELFRNWQLLTSSKLWNDPVTGLPQQKKEELTAASADGENWMLTPWAELTLVHAVEKPLESPKLGELRFVRAAEDTFAGLRGEVRSHSRSTGQVDIDATWTEWSDDVLEPAPARVTGHAHVGAITVGRGQDSLPLRDVRHEFRDTRHRNVAYTPTATTRFREYFHPVLTAQPALITRKGPDSTGETGLGWPVLSSRRPEPPLVRHLVPTFRWERSVDHTAHRVTRVRRHAGLRVYLDRPWFSSGDDELLAVVLDPGRTTDPKLPDEMVSLCGNDPVWSDTTVLPRLTAEMFPGAKLTAADVVTAETVAGTTAAVKVVAYEPAFDERQRLWFCDIDVDLGAGPTATAYFPYLRLALARYQLYSVAPLHLSKIVTAEFAQLMPDREIAAAMTTDGRIHLDLSGPAALDAVGRRVGPGLPGMAASRRIVASVQSRGLTSGELDWVTTDSVVELTCVARGPGFAWTGDLTPPPPRLPQLSRYRMLVEEYETYLTDPATATGTVTAGGTALPVNRRLIHADYFGLATTLLGKIVLEE
ncbi:hypothetical protein M1P56_20105 [Streptomyces sp. HU2014]|uniref:hypothetical protein n=1 Tax=Streptomyces sp. HU2014 TaxID=2939414 RepID=UPI00200D26AD|nr:hypothetical protein [Streptomyces sp. HU2014]UQI46487.1 hypothetical protein M1P56_20105 [Streptomyces sp. HU2014]